MTVDRYEHIDIDERGYYCPTDDAWSQITDSYAAFYADEDEPPVAGTCRACGKPMTDTDECPASGADDRRHWPVV